MTGSKTANTWGNSRPGTPAWKHTALPIQTRQPPLASPRREFLGGDEFLHGQAHRVSVVAVDKCCYYTLVSCAEPFSYTLHCTS